MADVQQISPEKYDQGLNNISHKTSVSAGTGTSKAFWYHAVEDVIQQMQLTWQ
jgi:hypothetical protein